MSTYVAKPHEVVREWYLVDATNKILGRLASEIARRLRGKHKAIYTPHCDTGDNIIVTNVDKIVVTGRKGKDKIYYRHTLHPGGLKETCFDDLQAKAPEMVLRLAVQGMLPKGPLGRAMITKLKMYAGSEHPHAAQKPKVLDIKEAD